VAAAVKARSDRILNLAYRAHTLGTFEPFGLTGGVREEDEGARRGGEAPATTAAARATGIRVALEWLSQGLAPSSPDAAHRLTSTLTSNSTARGRRSRAGRSWSSDALFQFDVVKQPGGYWIELIDRSGV
jgi:hypothetical protein